MLLIAIAALCLITQVLMRPAVGIANNNDFAKMSEPLRLGPEDGDWLTHTQYGGFLYHYVRDNRYEYNRGFRTAQFLSSEFFFVKLARGLQRIVQPGPRFDIRWLGGVTAAFFLLALGLWIYALPGRWRVYEGVLVVLIWTDVAYVQYLNSFYMDSAAMIFLVMAAAAGLHVAQKRQSLAFPLLMTSAVTLFAASKSQHALPALVFIPLFLGFAFWSRRAAERVVWIAGTLVMVLAGWMVAGRDTLQQRTTPVYTMVFWRLAPQARDPLQALQELGLGKDELQFLHTYAYFPHSPLANEEWARQFQLRCNYSTLFRYYLRHLSVPIQFLYNDLSAEAANILPIPFGNLSPEDGFPPFSRSSHFTWWSNFRAFLLKHFPWHRILLALAMAATGLWLLVRSPGDRALAGLALTIQALAALEYGIAILADAAETDRHLFIFHVATEISILLFPLLLWRIRQRVRGRTRGRAWIEANSSLPSAVRYCGDGSRSLSQSAPAWNWPAAAPRSSAPPSATALPPLPGARSRKRRRVSGPSPAC